MMHEEDASDAILFGRWPIKSTTEVVPVGTGIGAWAELDHLGGQEAWMTRSEAEALAATAARALARLDQIDERYGQDDMIDGAILRFMRAIHGRVFGYAALRAGGLWYLTGRRSPQGLTWAALTAWLAEHGIISVERLSTGYGPEEDDEDTGTLDVPFET